MKPLVTISIPVFKCERSIVKCMQSVLEQTYPNLEVILVDDCTPDQSADLVKDFILEHTPERWKLVHLEQNSGLSVVRNTGIELAQGSYIFFLDSDDEIIPETIEKLIETAENTGA